MTLDHSEKFVNAFLYFEAVQEILVSKAIAQSKKAKWVKGESTTEVREAVDGLERLQKRVEDFQEVFCCLLLKEKFHDFPLSVAEGAFDEDESLTRLWSLLMGESLDRPIDEEEALGIKNYFEEKNVGDLKNALIEEWGEIVDEAFKALKGGKA